MAIFVPFFIPTGGGSREPARCPACGAHEQIVRGCAHCHYEYPSRWPDALAVPAIVGAAVVGLILFLSFVGWAISKDSTYSGCHCTYVEYLGRTWAGILDLARNLW